MTVSLRLRMRRWLGASLAVWALTFAALVWAKADGLLANPWPVVLAPLWLPVPTFVAYKVLRLALALAAVLIVLILS